MRLDSTETIELDLKPDEKLKVVWFFSKTIGFFLAMVFMLFVILLNINLLNLNKGIEKNNKIEIEQNLPIVVAAEKSNLNKRDHQLKIVAKYWPWVFVIGFVFSILFHIYLKYLHQTYSYIITNKRVIFIGGVFRRVERSVPYKKITDIQRSQNLLERMLGIWNVEVFTPGTASMQVGIHKAKAEINFYGLVNSEDVCEIINKFVQDS